MSMHAQRFARSALILSTKFGRKGIRTAAGYLRNRDVSLEDALFILTGRITG